ncbi:hypothetical protein EI94DRAFT_1833530 [Lactarius quietus]|nr:hypothetical protein EI94DRAFT_1833530 [Lactarius quietus]
MSTTRHIVNNDDTQIGWMPRAAASISDKESSPITVSTDAPGVVQSAVAEPVHYGWVESRRTRATLFAAFSAEVTAEREKYKGADIEPVWNIVKEYRAREAAPGGDGPRGRGGVGAVTAAVRRELALTFLPFGLGPGVHGQLGLKLTRSIWASLCRRISAHVEGQFRLFCRGTYFSPGSHPTIPAGEQGSGYYGLV